MTPEEELKELLDLQIRRMKLEHENAMREVWKLFAMLLLCGAALYFCDVFEKWYLHK